MYTHIAMTLLKTIVFPNIMQIIPANNYSTLHFHLLYNTSQYTSSNRYIASEWTFLIDIGSLKSFARRLETEPDIAAISHGLPAFWAQTFLAVKKDRGLLLERALALQQTKSYKLAYLFTRDTPSWRDVGTRDQTTCYANSNHANVSRSMISSSACIYP